MSSENVASGMQDRMKGLFADLLGVRFVEVAAVDRGQEFGADLAAGRGDGVEADDGELNGEAARDGEKRRSQRIAGMTLVRHPVELERESPRSVDSSAR